MNNKKILAGLVLTILLFVIPQAVNADEITGTLVFNGEYESSCNEICDEINGEIIEGNLEGSITIRGSDCPLSLSLVLKRGDLEWYHGTITRMGRDFNFRMIIRYNEDSNIISGGFGSEIISGTFKGVYLWKF